MNIIERYRNLWNDRRNRLNYAYISSVVVIVIMVLLQPFGIDAIKEYKYPIILGYGFLTFTACILADIVEFIFYPEINPRKISLRILFNVLFTNIIMAIFISFYGAIIFRHNWRYAIFYADGTFYINTLAINFLYAMIISFFILICLYFLWRNKELNQLLKEEKELNLRIQNKISSVTSQKNIHSISIHGTTKESLSILPSQFIYAVSEGNYITIYYSDDLKKTKKTILRLTMKQLEDELKEEEILVRCHRAYIVNTEKVIHVSGNSQGFKLKVDDSEQDVPVSRGYSQEIYNQIHGLS